METYDVIVIGGGPAGYKAALKLASYGKNVALIEADESRLGGTCQNEGCIPVKSLVESALLYDKIKNSRLLGINAQINEIDFTQITTAMDKSVDKLKKGLTFLLKSKKVTTIYGKASFVNKYELHVKQKQGKILPIQADHFIIATGSKVKPIPGNSIDGSHIVSSKEILTLTELPKSLLIVGGGYIGCEFASIFNKLGVDVTVVEMAANLLPFEDLDISRILEREFKKSKIKILTGHYIKSLNKKKNEVEALITSEKNPDKEQTIIFNKVLLSIGRIPYTKDLNLDEIGLKTQNGFIPVNENFQTEVPHIYAVGDVINTPMLAHTAYIEGINAAKHITGKTVEKINYTNIPRIVFTTPQVAGFGQTVKGLTEKNIHFKVANGFFKANGKAVLSYKDAGIVNLIYEPDTKKMLGASIIGPEATEMIHELGLAIQNNLTIENIKKMVHGHPTLSELIWEIALAID